MKTPIPTDLNKIFGSDHLSHLIFERLLIRARHKDNSGTDYWYETLVLNRGQSVCGCKELGKWFNRDPKTIKRHLDKLQYEYKIVDNLPTRKGTITTIKNYGWFVKWDNPLDNPKQVKVDNPLPKENIVDKAQAGTDEIKRDNPTNTKRDTNKNINTNTSFKGKSYPFIPKVLGDLTPEQRKKVEFI